MLNSARDKPMTLVGCFDQGLDAFNIAIPTKSPALWKWQVIYPNLKTGLRDPEFNSIDLDALSS
jgi:hypothetical protein